MMRTATLVLIAAMLAGCKTTQTAAPDGVPAPFELKFQSRHTDGRATYYELDRDLSLGFGGGRDGRYAIARPVGKITDAQARQLWDLIRTSQLLEADGWAFALKYEQSRYDIKIRAGGESNGFTVADDDVPAGVEELEKLLFEIQGELRYGKLFDPIDEAVRKGGGTIKKDR